MLNYCHLTIYKPIDGSLWNAPVLICLVGWLALGGFVIEGSPLSKRPSVLTTRLLWRKKPLLRAGGWTKEACLARSSESESDS